MIGIKILFNVIITLNIIKILNVNDNLIQYA